MTLQDGTVVWLNSETKMRYPVQFSGQNREVWLEGEAYFKVAKNEKQPFVVKTENMDVRVLGTEFNLKAYADEKWVQAIWYGEKWLYLRGWISLSGIR